MALCYVKLFNNRHYKNTLLLVTTIFSQRRNPKCCYDMPKIKIVCVYMKHFK